MTNPARIAKGLYWDRAWSLVGGCSYVSEGCLNCWSCSETRMRSKQANPKIQARYVGLTDENGKWNGLIRLHTEDLDLPLRVKKPTVWAVWNDLFHEDVPFEFIAKIFGTMHSTKQHVFLVLTKRPERMAEFIIWYRENWLGSFANAWPREYSHVWLGVTAENQPMFDKRVPILLSIPAAIHWVSYEPVLGPLFVPAQWIDYGRYGQYGMPTIKWFVCGGESGPKARPMHPDWVRSLRDQCQAAGVKFFFKQWGEWAPFFDEDKYTHCEEETLRNEQHYINPDGSTGCCWITDGEGIFQNWTGEPNENCAVINRVGKKRAGRLLDGREWSEFPDASRT